MNSLLPRDGQVKSMEQTVTHAEKFLGQFCSLLASYTRKTAKLRDKVDLLVQQLFDFSNTEDPELRIGLKNLAEDLAMVQDYRQAQVERLETRVIAPLKAYGDIIKNKRADLKRFSADRSRELKELQKLEKIRQKNPADRQSISQAEVNAQKASNNAQRNTKQLEETINDFQRQKLEDIKTIFTDFITVEMLFHAKALEIYTHTFQNLESIDIDKDMEMFSARIRMSEFLSGHMDTLLTSHSTSSMNHTSPKSGTVRGQSLSPALASSWGQSLRRQHSSQPEPARKARTRILRRQKGVEEEEEKDEEEAEDEEEEEDMYESETEEVVNNRQSYAAQYTQIQRQYK